MEIDGSAFVAAQSSCEQEQAGLAHSYPGDEVGEVSVAQPWLSVAHVCWQTPLQRHPQVSEHLHICSLAGYSNFPSRSWMPRLCLVWFCEGRIPVASPFGDG